MTFDCEFCESKNLPIGLANIGVFNPMAGGEIVCCDECRKALSPYQKWKVEK
jgi:hypothetical protein